MKKLKGLFLLTLMSMSLTACGGVYVQNIPEGQEPSFAQKNLNSGSDEAQSIYEASKETVKDVVENEEVQNVASKTKEVSKSLFGKAKEVVSEGLNELTNGSSSNVNNEYTGELANIEIVSGMPTIMEINGNKSTLDRNAWEYNHIEYSDLDGLNRVGTATAYLEKNNVGPSNGRGGQTWQPTGFKNQKVNANGKNKTIYDRGHLIAYTISYNLDDFGNVDQGHKGSENNPKNLATQTAMSNQGAFQRVEGQVRDELKKGNRVIYQVTPVFSGNDLVMKGFHAQAISVDSDFELNVFVPNVQSGVSIDYATGNKVSDSDMQF